MQRFEVPYIPARTLFLWTLGVVAMVACFWLLIRFQNVLLLLLAAVILSTALRPAVLWLEKRGIKRAVSILIGFVIIVLLAFLILWYTVPILAQQGTRMLESLSEGYAFLRAGLESLPNILVRRVVMILPEDLTTITNQPPGLSGSGSEVDLQETMGQGRRLFGGVFQVIAIGILTFYWTLEGERVKQAAFLLLPIRKRPEIRELVQEIEDKLRGYLLGQGLLSITIGVVTFIAYSIIGLPDALVLALFAGIMEAVPIIGPFIGAIPAFLVALSISPLTALWVVLATLIVQQLEGNLLVPRVMNRTIGVRPLVTLLALLAFGSLFGVLGALVALPLAAVIQILLDRFVLNNDGDGLIETGRDQFSVLRYETNQLIQDVRNQIRHKETTPQTFSDELEDEMEAIALDIQSLLAAQGDAQK